MSVSSVQLPQPAPGRSSAAFGRAGVMQQAIVLEAASQQYDTLEVLLEGHNGQLPKLDMFHLLGTMGSALQVGQGSEVEVVVCLPLLSVNCRWGKAVRSDIVPAPAERALVT